MVQIVVLGGFRWFYMVLGYSACGCGLFFMALGGYGGGSTCF